MRNFVIDDPNSCMYTLRYTGGLVRGELESERVVNFGIDASPPTPPPGGSGACGTDEVGIGMTFGGCGETLPGGDGRKGTG